MVELSRKLSPVRNEESGCAVRLDDVDAMHRDAGRTLRLSSRLAPIMNPKYTVARKTTVSVPE